MAQLNAGKRQELLTLREHLSSPRVVLFWGWGGGSVLLICLVFCVVLLCLFMFWVPCCDVRCGFRMKRMFGSSLSPVVCRRSHVLFRLFLFVCIWWCLTHIVLCLRLMYLCCQFLCMDCPFLIVPFGCSLTFIWYACVSNKTKDENNTTISEQFQWSNQHIVEQRLYCYPYTLIHDLSLACLVQTL